MTLGKNLGFYALGLFLSLTMLWKESTEAFTRPKALLPRAELSVYDVTLSYCSAYNNDVRRLKPEVNKTEQTKWRPLLDIHKQCSAPRCVLDEEDISKPIRDKNETGNGITGNGNKRNDYEGKRKLKYEDKRPVLKLPRNILNGALCDIVLDNSSSHEGVFGVGICVEGECRSYDSLRTSPRSVPQKNEEKSSSPFRYSWKRTDEIPCSISCPKNSGKNSKKSTDPESSHLKVAVQCVDSQSGLQVPESYCNPASRDSIQTFHCIPCPTLNFSTSWNPDDVIGYSTDGANDYHEDNAIGGRDSLYENLLSQRAGFLSAGSSAGLVDREQHFTLRRVSDSKLTGREEREETDYVAALTDKQHERRDLQQGEQLNDPGLPGWLRRPVLQPPPETVHPQRVQGGDLTPLWWEEDVGRRGRGSQALRVGQKEEESKEISTTPAWGPCSVTCSTGIRTRRVICRVFVESNSSVLDLPDASCVGDKPSESELCNEPDCIGYVTQESYSWSITGYGPCSRSCAGGLQNPVFSCLRDGDKVAVKSTLCAKITLPSSQPRLCNEQRCPPRWRVFPDGQCSAPCGGGRQKRLVRCMLDAVDAGGESLTLPDKDCQATGIKPPPKTVLCNMAPCPPIWFIDGWSQCSVTCGVGVRQREVRCEQKTSLSTVETVSPLLCMQQEPQPETEQICDLSHVPCPSSGASGEGGAPVIQPESLAFVQLKPRGKIMLNAGSSATVILGNGVQFHCPVKKGFNKRLIQWSVEGQLAPEKGRIHASKKGVLRVRRGKQKDAGVYTCSAGGDTANVTLMFHSLSKAGELVVQRRKRLAEIGVDIRKIDIDEKDSKGKQDDEDEKPFSVRKLLTLSNTDHLNIHYVPTEWTPCSKTCGGSGYQSREISCHVIQSDYSLLVDDELCEKRGLVKPIESRDCGLEACPTWKLGQWGECDTKVCESVGMGTKSRPLYCLAENGTVLRPLACDQDKDSLPANRQPCPHAGCNATFMTSNWTRCSVSCGSRGISTRLVDCVWTSNGQSADVQACADIARPTDTKACYTLPCGPPECRDESHHCSLVVQMKICDYAHYRQHCCHSCSSSLAAASSNRQLLHTSAAHHAYRRQVIHGSPEILNRGTPAIGARYRRGYKRYNT